MAKECLGCICDAASGCNTTIGCAGDVCGPFKITMNYWTDGGKPTLDGEAKDDGMYRGFAGYLGLNSLLKRAERKMRDFSYNCWIECTRASACEMVFNVFF